MSFLVDYNLINFWISIISLLVAIIAFLAGAVITISIFIEKIIYIKQKIKLINYQFI